jgi:hypothetical protein
LISPQTHGKRYSLTLACLAVALLVLLLATCGPSTPQPTPEPVTATEIPVMAIPLAGPVANRNAEVSGLAWYGDHLIMLPQYPGRMGRGGSGALFALPRSEIEAVLDGTSSGPLEPVAIPFEAGDLARQIEGFEGFEAIAFRGENAYLTIEASPGGGMKGYLVGGTIAPDLSTLTLDTTNVTEIELQAGLANKSDETLLVTDEELLTLYEANGAGVNEGPVAHRFGLDLAPTGSLPLANVEYRVTDATTLDGEGRFWAINYFFPGEPELLAEVDPLAQRYGQGPTHARSEPVERLLELQLTEAGIDLVDRPPLQLELLPDEARNWEGLVRLEGRGFLLMTDKFPETILGFVPWAGE